MRSSASSDASTCEAGAANARGQQLRAARADQRVVGAQRVAGDQHAVLGQVEGDVARGVTRRGDDARAAGHVEVAPASAANVVTSSIFGGAAAAGAPRQTASRRRGGACTASMLPSRLCALPVRAISASPSLHVARAAGVAAHALRDAHVVGMRVREDRRRRCP